MEASEALSQTYLFSASQARSVILELIGSFGDSIEIHATNNEEQKCTALLCRLFRETAVIRDCVFHLDVYSDHVLLQFSRFEIVGNTGFSKEFLVEDIARSCRKAGLRLSFSEDNVYHLDIQEEAITKSLLPSSYKKKIDGLGIDWREAQ